MILRTSYSPRHATAIILILLAVATRLQAQTLQFTEPAANALTALVGGGNNYTVGEDVRIAWQSGYELTTLRVWQGPRADGSLVGQVLAANRTEDENTFTWTAARLDDVPLTRPFHFQILNGAGTDTADSLTFYVTRAAVSSTSSTSSSTSTSSTSLIPAPTSSASPTPTTDVAGAAATTPAPPATHNNDHSRALGLGLGLGLGILIIGILVALLVFCLKRRRDKKRRAENLPRGHQPNVSVSKPLMLHQDKSGALVPGLPGSPGHPQYAFLGAFAAGRNEGRDRASNGTASTEASSYHGPFPFEHPHGYREDFDSRSINAELRQIPRNQVGVAQSLGAGGSPSGSLRLGTPRSDVHAGGHGVRRMTSIDEDGPAAFRPPGTPPEWPLRPHPPGAAY